MEKMTMTSHNKKGVKSTRHQDRSNTEKATHIDKEKSKGNVYWQWNVGRTEQPNFEACELAFYEERYAESVKEQNKRNEKNRHTERNKTVRQLYDSKRTAPTETYFQIGNKDSHADGNTLLRIMNRFQRKMNKYNKNFHILDIALHVDEATPHIAYRSVIDYEKDSVITIGQDKGLEMMGFDLDNPKEAKSRTNNRLKSDDYKIYDGVHEAIVSRKIFRCYGRFDITIDIFYLFFGQIWIVCNCINRGICSGQSIFISGILNSFNFLCARNSGKESEPSSINNFDNTPDTAAARAAYDMLTDEEKAAFDPAVLEKLTVLEGILAAMLRTATAPGVSIEINSVAKLNSEIKSATEDKSFVLTQDIGALVKIADDNNHNFTIDLNGHSIESPEDTYVSAIEHLGEGTLTIMDSSPGQTGVITSEDDQWTIRLHIGKLVVNGGTVSNSGDGVAIYGGNIKSTIEVNGGNIAITGVPAGSNSAIHSIGTVNINNGTVNGGAWSNAIRVNAGGTANIRGGKVTGSGSYTNGSLGSTKYEIGTIELSGKGCTLNISGGTVENTKSDFGGGAAIYTNSENSTINIIGGTVSAVKCYAIYQIGNLKMTISGENTLVTSAAYSTESNEDEKWNSTIRLEGGTAEISGGTVQNTSGGRAIYNSGNLTISGGTVENTGTVADPRNDYDDGIYSIRSFTIKGSAKVQSPNGYAIKMGNYEKKVIIPSGSPVIRGTPPMVNDPDTSEYTNCRISASKSYDGTDLIRYVPGSSLDYKYMTFIESIQSPIDVAFADGTAVYNGAAQGYEKATCAEKDVAMTYTYTPKAGSSLTKGLPKNVGTYTVKATYDSNTHLGSKEATFTITPAPLTIADYTVSDREYDGTDAANIAVTFGGLQGGETLTIGDKNDFKVTDAKFAQKNASDQPIAVTGTAVLNDTAKAKNYTLAKGELKGKTAKISKCALYGATVIEGKGQKDYDGTKSFTDVPVKYFNYGSSETVTGTVSGTVGRADAGKDKELAVTEWKLDSAFAGNYTVPTIKTVNGKVEILPIDPIITIDAPSSQKPGTVVTLLVKVTNPEGATEGYPGYWDVSLAVDGNATVKTALKGVTGKPGEYTATYTLASNVPEGTLVTFTAKLPQATTNYNANTTGTQHKVAISNRYGNKITIQVNNVTTPYGGADLKAAVAASKVLPADITALKITAGEVTADDWKYFAGDNPGSTKSPFTTLTAFEIDASVTSVADIPAGTVNAPIFPKSIVSVTIPQEIKVGNRALYDRNKLTTVSLSAATSIGEDAFYNCSVLTSVSLPAATNIGDNAFQACAELATVSLPAATSIGNNAFYGCSALTSVSLPTATSIGDQAFFSCRSLATLKLGAPPPSSVGNNVFNGSLKTNPLVIVDENGNELTDLTALAAAQENYDKVVDGMPGSTATDGKWYGWKVREATGYQPINGGVSFEDGNIYANGNALTVVGVGHDISRTNIYYTNDPAKMPIDLSTVDNPDDPLGNIAKGFVLSWSSPWYKSMEAAAMPQQKRLPPLLLATSPSRPAGYS